MKWYGKWIHDARLVHCAVAIKPCNVSNVTCICDCWMKIMSREKTVRLILHTACFNHGTLQHIKHNQLQLEGTQTELAQCSANADHILHSYLNCRHYISLYCHINWWMETLRTLQRTALYTKVAPYLLRNN